jgi:hypothetical protein
MQPAQGAKAEPFHPALMKKLIQTGMNKEKQKRVTTEALLVSGELVRLFVQEARHRAGIEAECEIEGSNVEAQADNKTLIRPHHISKVAAELLMDFS